MTIEAKVILDSGVFGQRITTLQLRYPRFVHAEFMTHRAFSRNASSSRAVPIERMIRDVEDDPAMPVAWGSNKPGMQAGAELPHADVARECWLDAKDAAVKRAREMMNLGAHKQIVNRLLEPFAHISVVVTATEWRNFFELRCHPDADPTMRALAEAMRDALSKSAPVARVWHLPYAGGDETDWRFDSPTGPSFPALARISAARCARVSYLNHDGSNPDDEKDLLLATKLLASRHMSPFEHQAMRSLPPAAEDRNFRGWRQFRAFLEDG